MPGLTMLLGGIDRPGEYVPAVVVAVVLLAAVVALVVSATNARRDTRSIEDLEAAGRAAGPGGYSPRP